MIKFPQQNTNHSETGIGDKKLSVKLCYTTFQYFKMFMKASQENVMPR